MAVKALRLLQPAKGVNEAKGKGYCHTAKHKKARRQDTGNSYVVIPPEMMECLNKTEHKQIKLLLGKKKPALYYAWGAEYYENPKNARQLDPPRMLDSECVKQCGLKAMYLIACHSDASAYSLTNSPEWLHSGLWYFQLSQLFALANSMNVLDRIVVVGYDKIFEDDVIIALNGQEVMSLALFHEINFEGVQDCTEGGKSDVRCNNINVTYGYAKQGFQSQVNKDGLHSPLILKNMKTNCNNFSSLMKLSLFEQNNLDCCGILFDSDIRPSNVLAEHSLGYDLAGKLHSNFFCCTCPPKHICF
jgi:hypothetical protein